MKKSSSSWPCLALLLLIAAAAWSPATAAAQERPGFAGRWEGFLIFSVAETEVEFTVDLERGTDGSLTGTLTVPSMKLNAPLRNVQAQGKTLSFEYHDEKGARVFTGTLDEGVIRGQCVRPNGTIPFELARPPKNASAKKPPLEVLARGAQLQSVFDGDRDQVRLLLLLSPTCDTCRLGAGVVQRYVLNKIKDERLQVYVIWVPIRDQDNETAAQQAVSSLIDPRARHFWVNDLFLPESYQVPLKLQKDLAWDVYLLYPANAAWSAPVPAPSLAMHLGRGEMPKGTSLNGIELADEIRKLLASRRSP